jgi:hypothetical protein
MTECLGVDHKLINLVIGSAEEGKKKLDGFI